MRLSRRGLVGLGIVSAIVATMAIAKAGGYEVIDFATPSTATAGQNLACTIKVSDANTYVSFSSSPAGLSWGTTVTATGSQSVSVPTSGMFPPPSGTYTITATAGGVSKSGTVYISPIGP